MWTKGVAIYCVPQMSANKLDTALETYSLVNYLNDGHVVLASGYLRSRLSLFVGDLCIDASLYQQCGNLTTLECRRNVQCSVSILQHGSCNAKLFFHFYDMPH